MQRNNCYGRIPSTVEHDVPPQTFDDEEVATVVGLHVLGELTIEEGADRLGMDPVEFRDILLEADALPRHGPSTREDIEEEINVARRIE